MRIIVEFSLHIGRIAGYREEILDPYLGTWTSTNIIDLPKALVYFSPNATGKADGLQTAEEKTRPPCATKARNSSERLSPPLFLLIGLSFEASKHTRLRPASY